mmetsp:Transcript_19098/g.39994  ORF Transcript_19098/g.39994 Transcript_19098/m.39994 type:complete len:230 (-) Transcript_19098:372-1061(-)
MTEPITADELQRMASSQCAPPPGLRIVSLIPSATDICVHLGLGDAVVGITHCCDTEDLPSTVVVVTEDQVNASSTSQGDIHTKVVENGQKAVDAMLLESTDNDNDNYNDNNTIVVVLLLVDHRNVFSSLEQEGHGSRSGLFRGGLRVRNRRSRLCGYIQGKGGTPRTLAEQCRGSAGSLQNCSGRFGHGRCPRNGWRQVAPGSKRDSHSQSAWLFHVHDGEEEEWQWQW